MLLPFDRQITYKAPTPCDTQMAALLIIIIKSTCVFKSFYGPIVFRLLFCTYLFLWLCHHFDFFFVIFRCSIKKKKHVKFFEEIWVGDQNFYLIITITYKKILKNIKFTHFSTEVYGSANMLSICLIIYV